MLRTQTGLLSGHGCDSDGPFLSIDERGGKSWQRQRVRPVGQALSLRALPARHCTGRYDLSTARSEPCPLRRALDAGYSQCPECMRATGFNPAFYNADSISPQQQRHNATPHLVYLANFGLGLLKVGITHERRGVRRLLEQGTRMGVILARFDDAYGARGLEAQVVQEFGVAETVRAARKRKQLAAPFRPEVAEQELLRMVERIAEVRSDVDPAPTTLAFDGRYGSIALSSLSAVDLSEPDDDGVVAISGDCVAMVGDVLVVQGRGAQAAERFMCSVGALEGCAIELGDDVRQNRVSGQMALQF